MKTMSRRKKILTIILVTLLIGTTFISTGLLSQIQNLVSRAAGGNELGNAEIQTYPNFEVVSVYASFTGDDNKNAKASFKYKESSSPTWIQGMDINRIPEETRFAAFFFAKPRTKYDVEVILTDPDGVSSTNTLATSVTTRDDAPPKGSGKTYYVSAVSGSDSNSGTEISPFRTIQKAVDQSVSEGQKGFTIQLKAGTYNHEHLGGNGINVIANIGALAEENNWITIEPYPGDEGKVFIDGSDPVLATSGQNNWTLWQNGVYQANVNFQPNPTLNQGKGGYVAVDGKRPYFYDSQYTLSNTPYPNAPLGVAVAGSTLYLRLPDGSDPDTHDVRVSRTPYGFEMWGQNSVRIKGLTFQYLTNAVKIDNSNNFIFENNKVLHTQNGIYSSYPPSPSNNFLIQNNIFENNGSDMYKWGYDLCKAKYCEDTAIYLYGFGGGAVIRNNRIDGTFDGISIANDKAGTDMKFGHDSDIYNNTIDNCIDDAAELEGSGQTNIRFYGNTMNDCGSISLVPVQRGPVYVFRNTINRAGSWPFKLGTIWGQPEPSNGATYFYHNTAYISDFKGTQDSQGSAVWRDGIACSNDSFTNNHFRNNVIYAERYAIDTIFCTIDPTKNSFDYDLLYTTKTKTQPDPYGVRSIGFAFWNNKIYATIADFRAASGLEQHGIDAKPLFVNAAANDLGLANGSPGIDAGTTLIGFNDANSPWPTVGNAPDMGAIETGFTETPSTPSPTQSIPTTTQDPTPTSTPTQIPTPIATKTPVPTPLPNATDTPPPIPPTTTPNSANITGKVYIDTNKNGTLDTGEAGYQNAQVTLSVTTNLSTSTDASGNYSFNSLTKFRTYNVTLDVPNNYTNTTPILQSVGLSQDQQINFGIAPATNTSPLLGDINNDGNVDILDFNIWRNEFLGLSASKTSDGNKDSKIDLIDFSIWLNAFKASFF